MGPRVPFVSNPFGAISPNKVVETKLYLVDFQSVFFDYFFVF